MNIEVVFGSQTGNSLDLALQFSRSLSLKPKVTRISEIKFDISTLYIFFISTTGKGEFPYEMRAIWKQMMRKQYPKLKGMKFSVYGLGDRSYGDDFNVAARKFRKRLLMLQAIEIVEIGLGDETDVKGYKQAYINKWFPSINQFLLKNQSFSCSSNPKSIYPFMLRRQQNEKVKIGKIVSVCENQNRQTYKIELCLAKDINIQIGDLVCIYPYNKPQDVDWMIKYFKINPKDIFEGTKWTYLQLLREKVNLSSVVNYSFFIPSLSKYVQQELFKNKLDEIANQYDEYYEYIKQYRRNVVEVLRDFPIQINFQHFIQRIGPIFPRKYSISSINSDDSVEILLRLSNTIINANRKVEGVCSHDLIKWSNVGQMRQVSILKDGPFSYKVSANNNIIMIALGTGIAPFLPILKTAITSKDNKWNILLFYTNRYGNEYYFEDLVKQLQKDKKIESIVSFTRQGGEHLAALLKNNIEKIAKMIQLYTIYNLRIVMCGPSECYQFLCSLLQKNINLDIKLLEKNKILSYQHW